MAGIDLTNDRRSQLLQQLLAQQGQRPQIQSGAELFARLGEQLIRQQTKKKLQQEEASSANTTRSNEVAVLQKLLGGGDTDFQGRAITDQQGNQQNNTTLAQALSQLPSGNPTGDAISEAMIKRQFTAPEKDTMGTKTFREGDDFVTRETINGKPGKELSRSKIDRRKQIETGPPGSFETAGNRDEETKRKRAVLGLTGELAESLHNVQDNPRSTGMIGAGADAANTLGDLPIVGQFITATTKELTNLTPTELSEIRAQAGSMVGKLVPVITGDTSGRYTDREQERTENIQAQSKFWKTSAQVVGGLSELQSISIRGEIRINGAEGLALLAGQPIDIATDDGVEQWGEILMEQYGMPFDKALDEIEKHQRMLGQ